MAVANESLRSAGRYWSVPLTRAAVALVVGAVITFSTDHSPAYGLAVFGGFAVLSGLLVVLLHAARLATSPRGLLIASGAVDVLAGAVALALLVAPSLAGFVYLVAAWAVVSGVLEYLAGRRAAGELAAAGRDWRLVGIGTVLLGIVFAVLPPHPIVSVGLLGAYAVILGVFLGIAAFSLKWAAAGVGTPTQYPTDGGPR
ncbi:hypothetical protein HQQ80_12430 [Microbacteriaceae bacterium VKM Ac-2855]|nr:hypothetical protein [Microbacteriaceae bacterium VKM Ac-2855]